MRKQQSGIMLLEALIAILIFSIGILGIVGMQASTIKGSRDAKYRSDAGLLANELIGQMWIGARDGATLQTNFQGDGAASVTVADGPTYTAWETRVAATLPGVALNPPLVTVAPGVLGPPQTSSTVSVIVRWQAPNETTAHSYSVLVQII